MAFTTESLKDLGLNDEQVKGVMKAHGADVNEVKAKLNDVTAERDGLKGQIEDYSTKLAEAQKSAEKGSELSKQLEDIKQSAEKAKADADQKLKDTKLGYEIDMALAKNGALNTKATKALVDMEKVGLDDNGKLTGFDEQLEQVKKENAFLFKTEETSDKKPGINAVAEGNPASSENDKHDLSKMSYKEQVEFKQKDPEGYERATQEQ